MSAVIAPKPGIMDITPYKGGEARVEGVDRLVRLASNENALGTSDMARKAYAGLSGELHRYPDGAAADIRAALAGHYGLDAERIVCGAGSDELISLLIRAYAGPGDEIVYSRHGFLMYAIGAKVAGATPVAAPETDMKADVGALLERVTDKTKLMFIANPNNPTGSYLTKDELKELHDGLPEHVLLVIDAAYTEFVTRDDYASGMDMVTADNNVMVLRTFSKIFGLAGLRLGWGWFPEHVAGALNRVRGPFNASAPAQAAGIAALKDEDFLKRSIEHNDTWLPWLRDEFAKLDIDTMPSPGNFFVARFGEDAEEARLFLRGKGIFIRQIGAYGLPEWLRVTVGTEEENRILMNAVAEYVKR